MIRSELLLGMAVLRPEGHVVDYGDGIALMSIAHPTISLVHKFERDWGTKAERRWFAKYKRQLKHRQKMLEQER